MAAPTQIASGQRFKFEVEGYLDEIMLLAQQQQSQLMATTWKKPFLGNDTFLNQYKPYGAPAQRETRFADVVATETERQRRSVDPTFYEHAERFDDREDLLTQAEAPDSDLKRNTKASFYRDVDREIIESFDRAVTIDGSSVAYDATGDLGPGGGAAGASTIAYNVTTDVNDNTALSPDKVILAVQKLAISNVGIESGNMIYCAYPPSQLAKFLATDQKGTGDLDPRVSSSDFTNRPTLQMGRPTEWFGVNFRMANQIPSEAADAFATSVTGKYAYVYSGDAICLFENKKGFIVREDWLGEKQCLQLYHRWDYACMRTEGVRVARIECAE